MNWLCGLVSWVEGVGGLGSWVVGVGGLGRWVGIWTGYVGGVR